MGCNSSTLQVMPHVMPPVKEEHIVNTSNIMLVDTEQVLDESQIKIIRSTWNMMNQDQLAVGTKVFLRIFELRPAIKQLFTFRDAWGDELLRHPLFRAHSLRFMTIVGDAVDNMEGLDSRMAKPLFELGQKHIKHRGFTTDYFDCFIMSMLFMWAHALKGEFPLHAHEAWKRLLQWMVSKLKKGYDHEVYKLTRSGYLGKD